MYVSGTFVFFPFDVMTLAIVTSFAHCMFVQAHSSGNDAPEGSFEACPLSLEGDGMSSLNLLQHSAVVHVRGASPKIRKVGWAHEAKVAKISLKDVKDVHPNAGPVERTMQLFGSIDQELHQPVASTDTKATPSSRHQLVNACMLGCTFGLLHVVCPDHITSLFSFSVGKEPKEAFFVGLVYGAGHTFGIFGCALVLEVLQHALGSAVRAAFDHWANYAIGSSIIACGLLLYYQQSTILREDAAGRIEVQTCCCCSGADSGAGDTGHSFTRAVRNTSRRAQNRLDRRRLMLLHQSADVPVWEIVRQDGPELTTKDLECLPAPPPFEASASPLADPDPVRTLPDKPASPTLPPASPTGSPAGNSECPPPPPPFADANDFSRYSWVVSLTMGVVQGLFCPIFLVFASMMFGMHILGVLIFCITFVPVSCVGMGFMAMLWAFFSGADGAGACVSLKTVYQTGVFVTVSIGIAWMVLTYFQHDSR